MPLSGKGRGREGVKQRGPSLCVEGEQSTTPRRKEGCRARAGVSEDRKQMGDEMLVEG